MSTRKSGVATALVIIAIGSGWLLNNVGILPAVEWIWTLSLGIAGVLTLAMVGLDRVTAVIGPFLIISSAFSILRQTGRMPTNYEVPLLVIIFGVLWLAAVLLPLKPARWMTGESDKPS